MANHVIYALERREAFLTEQLTRDRNAPPMVSRERDALRDAVTLVRRVERMRSLLSDVEDLLSDVEGLSGIPPRTLSAISDLLPRIETLLEETEVSDG